MPVYKITHRTTYDYTATVVQSRHLLFLTPRSTEHQKIIKHVLRIDPKPTTRNERADYFGNSAMQIALERDHTRFTAVAESEVDVIAADAPDLSATTPWKEIADRRVPMDREIADYAAFSPLASPTIATRRFAESVFEPGTPMMAAARALMSSIFETFEFDPTATDISTPVDQVLKQKAGVCQDFAHLAIACLRSMNLPARYVSGYIRTHPPEGEERLVGADASHAWFSAWAPETGWVDFDPTNNLIQSTDHITVAYGRDFEDVSPISGVLLGGGDHTVSVSVDVAPLSEIDRSA